MDFYNIQAIKFAEKIDMTSFVDICSSFWCKLHRFEYVKKNCYDYYFDQKIFKPFPTFFVTV